MRHTRLFKQLAGICCESIHMRVEVDYGDWSVHFIKCAQNGENNRMVTTES